MEVGKVTDWAWEAPPAPAPASLMPGAWCKVPGASLVHWCLLNSTPWYQVLPLDQLLIHLHLALDSMMPGTSRPSLDLLLAPRALIPFISPHSPFSFHDYTHLSRPATKRRLPTCRFEVCICNQPLLRKRCAFAQRQVPKYVLAGWHNLCTTWQFGVHTVWAHNLRLYNAQN